MSWFLQDTKEQIYFEEILKDYVPKSKIAQNKWKNMKPYQTSEEYKWQIEMEQMGFLLKNIKENNQLLLELENLFLKLEDVRYLFDKLSSNWKDVDPAIDFFHMKQFLWFSYSLSSLILALEHDEEILQRAKWYEMAKHPWEKWLQLLQPENKNGQFYPRFAVQDVDDDALKKLRQEKRTKLKEKREEQITNRSQFEETYNLKINHDNYVLMHSSDSKISTISKDPNFLYVREQGNESVYFLQQSKKEKTIDLELNRLGKEIEQLEKERLKQIWGEMEVSVQIFEEAHEQWAIFEILIKKSQMALDMTGIKPEIIEGHQGLEIEEAVHPYLNKIWLEKKRKMNPVSAVINEGSTVLYGANMSGKTIILRTLGLVQALAQHGFYVPAKKCKFSFVSSLTLITGDYQNIEDGLSSFGAEIVRLKHDFAYDRHVLYLLDEVGKGTNPIEGEAMAIAILRYLKGKKGNISVLVTHFPNVIHEKGIDLYEIKNFKLVKVDKGNMVFEGLSTADALGLPKDIIDIAKSYLKKETKEGM